MFFRTKKCQEIEALHNVNQKKINVLMTIMDKVNILLVGDVIWKCYQLANKVIKCALLQCQPK
jgi:hypothetical protein